MANLATGAIPDPYAIDEGDMIVVDEANGSPGHSPKGESRGSRHSRKNQNPKKVSKALSRKVIYHTHT